MKTAYIFIDFENVQPNNVTHLDGGAFKIKIFVGAKQSKISSDMVLGLQAFQPEYIRVERSAPNALDFYIAYYIGRLAVQEPGSTFHIISSDKGYDPLIDHLEKQGIKCRRWKAITDIPHARTASAKAVPVQRQPAKPSPKAAARPAPKAPAKAVVNATPSQADEAIANLIKRGPALPSTIEKLASTVKSALGNRISDKVALTLIEELRLRGIVAVKDGKVTYHLPT